MNDRTDIDVRLVGWLTDEASARAPERLVHRTRERVAATRQIGRIRVLRLRLRRPTTISRAPVVAAAVLTAAVVVVASLSILGSGSRLGVGPGSPAPTPRPSLSSLPPYACEPGQGTCLGPLPAGVYETHTFLPQVGYVLPDGWVNTVDIRGEADLSDTAGGSFTYPDGLTFHDGISLFRRPVAISSSTGIPVPGIGTRAVDLAQWLNAHPDIDASGLTPVTVGGAPGYRINIALPKAPRSGPDRCTDHGVPACESLFKSDDPAAFYGFGIVGPESAVVYLLDAPSGDTVMAVIDDVDGVDRQGLIAAATPIVESLVFAP